MLHFDAPSAGFKHRTLRAGNNHHAAAASFGVDLSFGRTHLDASAAGVQRDFSADCTYVDAAAAGFGVDRPSNIIETNAAATSLTLDPAADACGGQIASFSFDLHQIGVARNVDHEFARRTARPAALPFAQHPCGVSAHRNADLVGLEFAAGLLFGRRVRMIADDVVDGLLRTAHHSHHAGIHFHPQIFRRRQRAGDLARPFAVFLINADVLVRTHFLGHGQRQQQQHHRNDFG